jgi:hypothetical protein
VKYLWEAACEHHSSGYRIRYGKSWQGDVATDTGTHKLERFCLSANVEHNVANCRSYALKAALSHYIKLWRCGELVLEAVEAFQWLTSPLCDRTETGGDTGAAWYPYSSEKLQPTSNLDNEMEHR